jgi:hypothetical protein
MPIPLHWRSAGEDRAPGRLQDKRRLFTPPICDARVTPTNETERVRAIYERMAGGYDRMIANWERRLFDDSRQWVCWLICTNDGFLGLDGVRLPDDASHTSFLSAGTRDAKTITRVEREDD